MPWWLDPLAALAAVAVGVLALLIYIIAAGLVLGAIAYLAVKVYKWLEEHL